MEHHTRATCLNCMDGRTQLPVLHWIKDFYQYDCVDIITEAGIDGIIAQEKDISVLMRSIDISVNTNGSQHLFIVGHHDCKGHQVSDEIHQDHIRLAVERLKPLWPAQQVTGLWVNDQWRVTKLV